jgi:uncharacterized protein YkwD
MLRQSIFTLGVLILLSLVLGLLDPAKAQSGYDPTVQTQMLLYDEANTVYQGNLARRDNGIPPLRWNLQLTHAARWFSWDSTENRPDDFCGHQDTLDGWPGDRAYAFGYLGGAGAENAFCAYLSPADAIQGWMNSQGHRDNLLDPNSREIGLGYYRRDSDGRGYVTQDFGNDAVYAPVIIENEAISTISPNVNLYIYDRSTGGGFAGFSAATQMMVSNNAQFSGATWEPYNSNKAWTLTGGTGWRNVYVKTRDWFNRTMTVRDTIYLGATAPLNELGAAQMSTRQSQVTLYGLNGGALPQVQFSPGWLADDSFGTFGKLWGNGERVNDAVAWGGTAFHLYPGNGESSAWVWDTTFIKDVPLVAYFRLKVNNNTSSGEVARVSIAGGGTVYGPLSLRGTDFAAPNQYQEFALNFTFNSNPNDDFLIFQFWQSGSDDVYVDAVSIFSTPQPITSPLTWSVPGNNYRGQGVWVRYTNGSQFSEISEADSTPISVLSILRASGNPTSAGSVDFTITFPESVTGVDTSVPFNDFALTTAGVSGAAITDASGSGTTYTVTVNTGSGNGTIRLDVVDDNTIMDAASNPLGGINIGDGDFTSGEVYTILKEPTFIDVSTGNAYWQDIEILYANGYTGGCSTSPLLFCPDMTMNRAQSAVFMVRGNFGGGYVPIIPTHFFGDNWSNTAWAEGWAESMFLENLSGGCSTSPLLFCPEELFTNVQAAVFGLRMKHGVSYQPPAASGTMFTDMTDVNFWGTAWAEQAYAEGLLPACGTSGGKPLFCPNSLVSRGFGASIIVNAKNLTMP